MEPVNRENVEMDVAKLISMMESRVGSEDASDSASAVTSSVSSSTTQKTGLLKKTSSTDASSKKAKPAKTELDKNYLID